MRKEEIQFKGINRKLSKHLSSNHCEELINVKQSRDSLRIVPKRKTMSSNAGYNDIFIHEFNERKNYIGITDNKVTQYDVASNAIIKELYEFSDVDWKNIKVGSISNMLVIHDLTKAIVRAYRYMEGYEIFYEEMPPIPKLSIVASDPVEKIVAFKITVLGEDGAFDRLEKIDTLELAKGAIAARNKMIHENEDDSLTEGSFLLCVNYTLWDGAETKTSTPIEIDMSAHVGGKDALICSFGQFASSWIYRAALRSVNVTLILGALPHTELIKSINIYISETTRTYDFNNLNAEEAMRDSVSINGVPVLSEAIVSNPPVNIRTLDGLAKKLFYKAHTINITELTETGGVFKNTTKLDFESLVTKDTLEVDGAGWIEEVGEMYSYNNRLHLYNMRKRIVQNAEIFDYWLLQWQLAGSAFKLDRTDVFSLYVYLKLPYETLVLKYDNVTLGLGKYTMSSPPGIFVYGGIYAYPDARAYKIGVYKAGRTYCTLNLSPSPSHNYSYVAKKEIARLSTIPNEHQLPTIKDTYAEPNIINVSELGNPIHFPTQHSYLVDGHIVGMSVAMSEVSQSQVGQYPLYVFTQNGIWALEQGSGVILYGALLPISPDKCHIGAGSICLTRLGIIYMANKAIYLLRGRSSTKISEALEGEIDIDIRAAKQYSKTCCYSPLYNVGQHLSILDFRDFTRGGSIVYNPVEEEVIISNSDYHYSYVYMLEQDLWYKTSESFVPSNHNAGIRRVFNTITPPQNARSSISIDALVIAYPHVFSSANKAIFNYASVFVARGHTISLVIGNRKIASLVASCNISLHLIVELLSKDISSIEVRLISGGIFEMYSSMSSYTGSTIKIINESAGSEYSQLLVRYIDNVIIPAKGLGSTFTLILNDIRHDIIVGENYYIIANSIASIINQTTDGITAEAQGRIIEIIVDAPGIIGNNNTISVDSSTYCRLSSTPFEGGAEETINSSNALDIVDLGAMDDSDTVIHIQTRPNLLNATGYKLIHRSLLLCNMFAQKIFGVYIFCSNDLKGWDLCAAAQKQGHQVDSIRLNRIAQSYKYFIVVIGGEVSINAEIGSMLLEVDDRLSRKLR